MQSMGGIKLAFMMGIVTKRNPFQKASRMNHIAKALNSWKWKNRTVYLVDGTTLLLADTHANQESYP